MSLDKPRSRRDISDEISEREQDKKKRLEDTEKVVQDKKTEADTANALNLSGTSEGTEEIKKSVEGAADVTDTEFEKQEKDLENKVFDPAEKLEKDLTSRSDDTKKDIERIKQGTSRIDTNSAKGQMETAEKGAQKDREFIDTEEKRQEKDRVDGEKERDSQKQTIKGTRVSFRH